MGTNIGSTTAKLYLGEIEISGGGGGISGGYNVSFSVDGTITKIVSVTAGDSIVCNPFEPQISGKAFTGWYSGSTKINFPYTPSGDVTLIAGLVVAETCTISGLGSSSPSSVIFTKSSGWSDAYETVEKDGDTFKKFPTMWRKVNTTASSQITSITIATAQIDSSYEVYPCFLAEDGTTVLPYILMGVSCSNADNTCNSIAGYTGSVSVLIGTGRTNARNRGTGYQIMDWMIFKLWQDLLICAMETINTNSRSGITTDALGIYWGNTYPWVDGVARNASAKWVFSYKPTSYVDSPTASTTDYIQASYSTPTISSTASGYNITKLGYDSSNHFFNYPSGSSQNTSYDTYYCDGFYGTTDGNYPVLSYVGLAGADYGAFLCAAFNSWTFAGGVRLCYRPL